MIYKLCAILFFLLMIGCSDSKTEAEIEKTQGSVDALVGRIEWTKQRLDSAQKLNEKSREDLKSLDMDLAP